MRAVIQKVSQATVRVCHEDGRLETVGQIGHGLTVLLGVANTDTEQDARYLADKIAGLRIFEDDEGKLNQSVQAVCGAILLVSQFTLYGDARNGRRPSYAQAARPEAAQVLYQSVAQWLADKGISVATGRHPVKTDSLLLFERPKSPSELRLTEFAHVCRQLY